MTATAAAQLVGQRVRVVFTPRGGHIVGVVAAADSIGLLLDGDAGRAFVPWAGVLVAGVVPVAGGLVWSVAGETMKQTPGTPAGAA